MTKPNRDAENASDIRRLGRRLLLEQLENRQLLASDLLAFNEFDSLNTDPSTYTLDVAKNEPTHHDAATHAAANGSSSAPLQFRALGSRALNDLTTNDRDDFGGLEAVDLGSKGTRGNSQSHYAHGRHELQSRNGSREQLSQYRQDFELASFELPSVDFDRPVMISSRMTEAALLPALPPGFELIDRITVTQSSSLPLSSNSGATASRTEVALIADNNSVPPGIFAFAGKSEQELANNVANGLEQLNQLSGEGEGKGLDHNQVDDVALTPSRDSSLTGGLFADSDSLAVALDEALERFYSSDDSGVGDTIYQMSHRLQSVAASPDRHISVAAFVDSISAELRRKGMSEQQVAELSSLLKQIVQSDPAVRETGTLVTTGHASWTQYSRSGVEVYDFTNAMMAVPVDNSMLGAGGSDDVLAALSSSNAWTQRFGLADVAIVELASLADGTELGRTPYAETQHGAESESHVSPMGLIRSSWHPTLGKVGLVALACLANARLYNRASGRGASMIQPDSSRPRKPR